MIDSDDPSHADQRRVVARGFGPRQMAAYKDHVEDVARSLVDAIIDKGRCDVVADIARPLPMTLIGEMVGADPSESELRVGWMWTDWERRFHTECFDKSVTHTRASAVGIRMCDEDRQTICNRRMDHIAFR